MTRLVFGTTLPIPLHAAWPKPPPPITASPPPRCRPHNSTPLTYLPHYAEPPARLPRCQRRPPPRTTLRAVWAANVAARHWTRAATTTTFCVAVQHRRIPFADVCAPCDTDIGCRSSGLQNMVYRVLARGLAADAFGAGCSGSVVGCVDRAFAAGTRT